jgi:hypothetical protein
MERGGVESFKDVHVILTQRSALTVHVFGPKADLSIDFAKWNFGEPIKDDEGKVAARVGKMAIDLNAGIKKLQGLVKKGRQAPEQAPR